MGIADAKQAIAGGEGAAVAEAPPEPAPAEAPAETPLPNHYCLSKDHASQLVTRERFFYYAGEVDEKGELVLVPQGLHPVTGKPLPALPDQSKAPVCPVCSAKRGGNPLTGRPVQERVSAVPLDYNDQNEPLIPSAILEMARRIGEA